MPLRRSPFPSRDTGDRENDAPLARRAAHAPSLPLARSLAPFVRSVPVVRPPEKECGLTSLDRAEERPPLLCSIPLLS